jgi:hypothetical protein
LFMMLSCMRGLQIWSALSSGSASPMPAVTRRSTLQAALIDVRTDRDGWPPPASALAVRVAGRPRAAVTRIASRGQQLLRE